MLLRDFIKKLTQMELAHPEQEILFANDEEGNVLHRKISVENTLLSEEGETVFVVYPHNSKEDVFLT